MSLTVSRGFSDARRWTGVAASVAEFLDASLRQVKITRPPRGSLKAAKQFFRYVLEGIEMDRDGQAVKETPPMAGISSLSIACEVLSSLPEDHAQPADLDNVKKTIESHLHTIEEVISKLDTQENLSEVDAQRRQQLLSFLTELMRQGLAEEEAAIVDEEHPREFRRG